MNIYSGADATKYSILEPENLAVTYKRDLGDTYEVFSSLISTGIFNVCQYYSPNNKDLYSIPITSD